jgi:hypothetical protein
MGFAKFILSLVCILREYFEPVLITGFMKDIKSSDLISKRYLSEIDEVLVSTLNLCPSFATSVFMSLRLSGALVVHHPNDTYWMLSRTADALVVHGLIFSFIYDNNQETLLRSFILSFFPPEDETLLFDFLSNPQRSHHHAMDHRTHNSVTVCCFSYILNGRLPHFPGMHHWASKSKRRPWLWRWRRQALAHSKAHMATEGTRRI